jgi:BASS family bile acid:Na+ symporter
MSKYRSWVLPIAIVAGIFFHEYFSMINVLIPYLIFTILLLNFSSFSLSRFRVTGMDIFFMIFQAAVSMGLYLIFSPLNEVFAQGLLVGIICPVAASVAAVACILGADIERVTTYTLLGNLMVAIVAPIYFSFVGNNVDMPFFESFGLILSKIFPIIVLPMIVNIVIKRFAPRANQFLVKSRKLSFYLWAVALMITIGKTIGFIFTSGHTHPTLIFELSLASAIMCAIQFWIGKKVGIKYGDKVAGGQNLGQRNSALGIWLAYTYLDPLSSIFPASYSIWQNLYNSYQLYCHDKKSK